MARHISLGLLSCNYCQAGSSKLSADLLPPPAIQHVNSRAGLDTFLSQPSICQWTWQAYGPCVWLSVIAIAVPSVRHSHAIEIAAGSSSSHIGKHGGYGLSARSLYERRISTATTTLCDTCLGIRCVEEGLHDYKGATNYNCIMVVFGKAFIHKERNHSFTGDFHPLFQGLT